MHLNLSARAQWLLETAINEIVHAQQASFPSISPERIRSSSHTMVTSSLRMAIDQHSASMPLVANPVLNDPRVSENIKRVIREGTERAKVKMAASHRSNLIQLFTISGVAQKTAEAIVDEIVLS